MAGSVARGWRVSRGWAQSAHAACKHDAGGQVHRVRERRDALCQLGHAGADNILRVRRRRQGWACLVLRGRECCRRDVRDGEWTVRQAPRQASPHTRGTGRISRFGERRMRGTLHAVRRGGVPRRL